MTPGFKVSGFQGFKVKDKNGRVPITAPFLISIFKTNTFRDVQGFNLETLKL
jgi:hypothetical protein